MLVFSMYAILIITTFFLLFQFLCELGYSVKEVSDKANISHLEYRGICILLIGNKVSHEPKMF